MIQHRKHFAARMAEAQAASQEPAAINGPTESDGQAEREC
jgi:hypothetical protein